MNILHPQSLLEKLPDARHLNEWLNSGVLPEIIASNVITCSGDNAYERLLYGLDKSERINTGRLREKWLKRYDHLDHGGWWCGGIDLLTLEPSQWGCFKPDRPKLNQGKALKYESPPNCRVGIFALDVQGKALEKFPECTRDRIDPKFWEWVIGNTRLPIVITEGAKKAGAVLSQGVAAIALSGIYNFTDDGLLKPEIYKLIGPGREFIIAFDQDKRWHARNNVTAALKKLSEQLQDFGAQVSVLNWQYEDGKGIDDFIALNGPGEFSELIQNRLEVSEYLENHGQAYECKRIDHFAKFLDTQIKNLEYNLLTERVEWQGKPIELSGELQFRLLHEYNVIASDHMIINGFLYKAKQNAYHPVRRYLEGLSNLSPISIDDLSRRYFGTTDPFYDLLVKKWLIGAVARIFEPGCQFDNALILQGEQWAGKSQFFKVLGGKWFNDSFGSNMESPKSLMTLHRDWIFEWPEFDKITGKQDFNAIKDFLTRQTDTFVRQYGRESIEHPRMSVMAGSINPSAFLKDATGDRRFWVIPLAKGWIVPTEQLRSERDQIWSAAVAAYRAGESRYLSREEYEIHKKVNEQFRDSDIWLSTIENCLIDREIQRFSIERILLEFLGFTIDKIDTKSRNRVRDCLISLGCTPVGSRRESEYDGKARRVWQSPEKFPSQVIDEAGNGDNDDNGSDNGSVVVQNPVPERVTTVTTVNNGKNQNFLQFPKNNGDNGSNGNDNGSVAVRNPVPERLATVTTLDNGKKANFFQSQNNGKIPNPDPVEEAEESYEAGLIREIGSIFDRLEWDKGKREKFLITRYGGGDLEGLSRSDLIDAADLLIKIEEKSNGKNNYSLENNKRNC
jgi:predicted P-loop ATPase